MFKRNVKIASAVKVSNWRKSSLGTYKMTDDCQVYAIQTINIEPALNYIKDHPEKLSLTHMAGKAAALMVKEYPQINRLLRLGKFYPREDISIFFQVAMDEEGKDLSGHTVRNVDQLDLSDIKANMDTALSRMKKGDDFNYKKAKGLIGMLPGFLVGPILKLYGLALYTLNIWSPLFGAPRDPFGSMMITNIGSLGMQTGLVPLVGYSRCPLILAFGAVYDNVVAHEGKPIVRKCVDCCWTLDHRIIDGVIGAKMAKGFQRLMENPHLLEADHKAST